MHWFLDPILKHYADFSGRASRPEYWMFLAIYVLVMLTLMVAPVAFLYIAIINSYEGTDIQSLRNVAMAGVGLFLLMSVALLIPMVAITVRRLHDIGFSGWWYALSFVPFGSLVVLVFMFLPSQAGDNSYGPYPYLSTEPLPTQPVPMPVPAPSLSETTRL